ncbi:hypothetical protein HYPSUDRAFT_58592 [Hypholoma sublateritium FD-334 SS-4]|uniref:Uncharacterized protein n=1 Tax=Hypholoma sublateritium (strain FD-334 SS-4) TaxID=945553 RepID=A0A0D2LY52_HYPSF|nr:hypothetical protein HYPSUDRAFT_58592 [Hypholoma sublateritium FD-334 SS-4]
MRVAARLHVPPSAKVPSNFTLIERARRECGGADASIARRAVADTGGGNDSAVPDSVILQDPQAAAVVGRRFVLGRSSPVDDAPAVPAKQRSGDSEDVASYLCIDGALYRILGGIRRRIDSIDVVTLKAAARFTGKAKFGRISDLALADPRAGTRSICPGGAEPQSDVWQANDNDAPSQSFLSCARCSARRLPNADPQLAFLTLMCSRALACLLPDIGMFVFAMGTALRRFFAFQ